MKNSKKLIIFSAYLILMLGCSETVVINSVPQANYIPFTADSIVEATPKELKSLNSRKNYILVKSGEFWMGSPVDEMGRNNDEAKHLVKIIKPFWVSKFELTNEEWNISLPPILKRGRPVFNLKSKDLRKICIGDQFQDANYTIRDYEKSNGKKPPSLSFFLEEVLSHSGTKGNWEIKIKNRRSYQVNNKKFSTYYAILAYLRSQKIIPEGLIGQKNPVTRVSHSEATAYCWKRTNLAHKEGQLPKGLIYRLPTEAEWEYACRAGTTSVCGLGSGERLSGVNACLDGSRAENVLGGEVMLINRKKLSPIDEVNPRYPPNAWGIHDMHGNVMEWCHDYYGPYAQKPVLINPLGPFNGSRRVLRGGSFYRPAMQCRSASRAKYEPSYRGSETGFRLVIGYPIL